MPIAPAHPAEFDAARKLHAGHFAFMRAYVQGIPLRDCWDRYLAVEGAHTDLRIVRRTEAWLRNAFAAAARRHARPGLARLVRIDVARLEVDAIATPAVVPPPLDEFSAERGLEDFSYAEQLAAYEEVYGQATAPVKRGARLLRRQLEALSWLEQLAAESPQAGDGVRAWLRPALAERLEAAGLLTLRQLAERINGVGRNWHTGVAGIGAGKADLIVSLLQGFSGSTGLPVGPHVLAAPSHLTLAQKRLVLPQATDVVPLEKFRVPAALDGSAGQFRAPRAQCQLAAANDYEALIAFLREKQGRAPARPPQGDADPHPLAWLRTPGPTTRAYRTECERFMLWAILERKKPLSSITFEDATAYRSFLADPQPAERWCGARSRARWGPAWRPFEGPLSAAAQRRALTMLGTFYRFLVDQRYLTGNPWTGVRKPKAPTRAAGVGRSLTQEEWQYVSQAAAALPPTAANARLQLALPLLYYGRLRRAELVGARVGDLRRESYPALSGQPAVDGWVLAVHGKGDKPRSVPLSAARVAAIEASLAARGLPPGVEHPDNALVFLLGQALDAPARAPWAARRVPLDSRAGISAQTLYEQLKAFFGACADRLSPHAPQAAAQLRRASTHWLRHSGITASLVAGTPLDVEMDAVGHASAVTTSRYLHLEARRLLLQSQSFLAQDGDPQF